MPSATMATRIELGEFGSIGGFGRVNGSVTVSYHRMMLKTQDLLSFVSCEKRKKPITVCNRRSSGFFVQDVSVCANCAETVHNCAPHTVCERCLEWKQTKSGFGIFSKSNLLDLETGWGKFLNFSFASVLKQTSEMKEQMMNSTFVQTLSLAKSI